MRKSHVLLTGLLLTAGLPAAAGAATAAPPGGAPPGGAAEATADAAAVAGKAARPAGANPFLALLPEPSAADLLTWRSYASRQAATRAARQGLARAALPQPLLVDEDEPASLRGANESPATAQPVPGFGTGPGGSGRARLLGTLSPQQITPEAVPPSAEDDGSIPRARRTGIGSGRQGITTSGVVGDGPHGSARGGTGDFDFYRLNAVAGEMITVDTDTPEGELDSVVAVYDAAGELLAANDDDGESLDSLLAFPAPTAGTYYVLVTGFPAVPADPRDPASGPGAGSEGPYRLRLTVGEPDLDFYSVRLRKGDVLGVSAAGAARRVAVHDTPPRIEDVHGSSQDATFVLPAASPLPGGGNAVTEHVADSDGLHYVAVEVGDGPYDVTVEAYRPGLGRPAQTVFLDFDGARLNTNVFGGPGVRTLSPLRAFLGRWGLRTSDLGPLASRITAVVRENLLADVASRGGFGAPAVRVLNSAQHPDPWGQPGVTRVIVGGTVAQSGVPTIGIAQSIDPGNFETEESGLVLLDLLSDPAGEPYSLNSYLRPRSDRLAFVGQAVGNVASHEAGHMLGAWHVDQFNARPNLMDQGGNFPVLYGVGPDGIGGTADDRDVDFGEDVFNPNEGFTGIEDTLTRVAVALSRRSGV